MSVHDINVKKLSLVCHLHKSPQCAPKSFSFMAYYKRSPRRIVPDDRNCVNTVMRGQKQKCVRDIINTSEGSRLYRLQLLFRMFLLELVGKGRGSGYG
jgi:hypothetical protein